MASSRLTSWKGTCPSVSIDRLVDPTRIPSPSPHTSDWASKLDSDFG